MEHNPDLAVLPDFPFDRLRDLLDGIAPPDGLEPISLAIGEPQQPIPAFTEAIIAEGRGSWNKYPPFTGSPELHAAVAGWLRRRYGLGEGDIDAKRHILSCAGTREALYLLPTWAVPREKNGGRPIVAMPNPFYHVYGTGALASGAESLYLPATPETGHLPDLDALDAATLGRLAMLVVCTPANPQGVMADAAYLERAVSLARKHDFLLVVDECYADVYDKGPPTGVLEVCRSMSDGGFDNVIAFHSLSKRSNGAGLRSGFFAGDPAIIAGYGRFRRYIAASIPLPIDAASAALWADDDHAEQVRAFYRANIDAAEAIVGGHFGFYRPPGGFFLWLDVGDGEAATAKLWGKAGLKVLAGAHTSRPDATGASPGDRFIRVALVTARPVLEEALRRLVNTL
ncbi:MAG: aminotransferase class I/II-fold pyridoxal phosphate-dependent enzyme [Rhodospirillales bacterium]